MNIGIVYVNSADLLMGPSDSFLSFAFFSFVWSRLPYGQELNYSAVSQWNEIKLTYWSGEASALLSFIQWGGITWYSSLTFCETDALKWKIDVSMHDTFASAFTERTHYVETWTWLRLITRWHCCVPILVLFQSARFVIYIYLLFYFHL